VSEQSESDRLKELAEFLRSRRARISPEEAGFADGGRRRTPGLRRSEVAQLSGMSVDWYTWMEQARPIQVSAQVLESLSRALRLDAGERKHLYLLALRQLPADALGGEGVASETLRLFLERQEDMPAVVYDLRLNVVGWNRPACVVYGDYERMTARERNTVWRTFTSPYVRELLRDGWEAQAHRRLAQFRANYAKLAGDPWWKEFVEELGEASPEFREWWPRHDVKEAKEGSKLLYHPIAGPLAFGHLSFQPFDAPDLTVTINLPLEEHDTAAKIRRLLAGG